jgi:hypothetical protein
MISFHIVNITTLSRVNKFFPTIHSNAFDCNQAVVKSVSLKIITLIQADSFQILVARKLSISSILGFGGELPSKKLSFWNLQSGSLLREIRNFFLTGRFVFIRSIKAN